MRRARHGGVSLLWGASFVVGLVAKPTSFPHKRRELSDPTRQIERVKTVKYGNSLAIDVSRAESKIANYLDSK